MRKEEEAQVMRRPQRLLPILLTAVAALACVAGAETVMAAAKPAKPGSYRGTTSEGLPVSFKVGKPKPGKSKLYRGQIVQAISNFSFATGPIQCENGILPDPSFTGFPRRLVLFHGAKGEPTQFGAEHESEIRTADANFLLYRFLKGYWRNGGFRGDLLYHFKVAGPNYQVGQCGTPADVPGGCPIDANCGSSSVLTWTASRTG